MGDLIILDNHRRYNFCEVMCLACLDRYQIRYPAHLPLKNIICECGERGYLISTGCPVAADVATEIWTANIRDDDDGHNCQIISIIRGDDA